MNIMLKDHRPHANSKGTARSLKQRFKNGQQSRKVRERANFYSSSFQVCDMYGAVYHSKVKLDEFELFELVAALQHVVVVLPLRRTVSKSQLKPPVCRLHLHQTLRVTAR